jgi:hypothetical protein
MAKKLKIWNGRGAGKKYQRGHIYVAAYSQKHAAELINEACNAWITPHEISKYYSPCWGTKMDGIEPTEPCVYASEDSHSKPIRIL